MFFCVLEPYLRFTPRCRRGTSCFYLYGTLYVEWNRCMGIAFCFQNTQRTTNKILFLDSP